MKTHPDSSAGTKPREHLNLFAFTLIELLVVIAIIALLADTRLQTPFLGKPWGAWWMQCVACGAHFRSPYIGATWLPDGRHGKDYNSACCDGQFPEGSCAGTADDVWRLATPATAASARCMNAPGARLIRVIPPPASGSPPTRLLIKDITVERVRPEQKALLHIRWHQVQALLMGGQACVFYGAVQFSKDVDLVLLAAAENFARLREALDELQAERIAVPRFDPELLARGHAVHFRCRHPLAPGLPRE